MVLGAMQNAVLATIIACEIVLGVAIRYAALAPQHDVDHRAMLVGNAVLRAALDVATEQCVLLALWMPASLAFDIDHPLAAMLEAVASRGFAGQVE